ncbi:MAG: T9SS type A sorting domain-containing protein [Bacteroidia bacterium]|nr:T9SS type A sorting domain-containing protein [Bacteroidia bacterium]
MTKKIHVLIVQCLLILAPIPSYGQTPQAYQSNSSHGLLHNNIIYKNNPIGQSFIQAKLNIGPVSFDSSGAILNAKSYGGFENEELFGIDIVNESGNDYILWSGVSRSLGPWPLNMSAYGYIIKTNLQLDTVWTRLYDRLSLINKVVSTKDSNYLAKANLTYGQVIKINSQTGDTIWSNNIDFFANGSQNRIRFTGGLFEITDSAFYIGGLAYPNDTAKLMLMKTDTLANPVWVKAYGDTAANFGWDGIRCYDGGFALVGQTAPDGGLNPDTLSYKDFLLIRTDENGDTLWCKRYDLDGGTDKANFVEQTNDKGFAILGISESHNIIDTSRVILLKVDSLGNVEWVKCYNELSNVGQRITGFNKTDNNGFIWFSSSLVFIADSLGENCYAKPITITQYNAPITVTNITTFFTFKGMQNYSKPNTIEYAITDTASKECFYTSNNFNVIEESRLSVYPNPNSGFFTIEMESINNTKIEIEMINTLGQVAETKEADAIRGKNSIDFKANKLTPGIYFLNIKGENFNASQKIIIH